MSPAGYWPQLRAAIEAGADAVYFGLKHFTARAKAGFDLDELPEAIRTLHARGVKGFVTFNTLVFDHELEQAEQTIAAISQSGADAIIVQDVGIAKLASQVAPDLEIHGSTQMSVTSAEGAELAREFGCNRVVLARELSLRDIEKIRNQTSLELEVFVHGALCVSYSGQCLSSEAWGGRSANRGQCAQACRLAYELIVDGQYRDVGAARYLLSPGDLYALEQIPELVRIGVACVKIEGRYKDAEYVAATTASYREAIDAAVAGKSFQLDQGRRQDLEQVYSRGLGPWFMEGTNHQRAVDGRAPRHRGLKIGRVKRVSYSGVFVETKISLYRGDGVVFDAADRRSPDKAEQGGFLFDVREAGKDQVEIRFGDGAVDLTDIEVGDQVWRTQDPSLKKRLKPFTQANDPVFTRGVRLHLTAITGQSAVLQMEFPNPVDDAANPVVVQSVGESPVAAARSKPATDEQIRQQLSRMGGSGFHAESIAIERSDDAFLPASVLNEIRRQAVDLLTKRLTAVPERKTSNVLAAQLAESIPDIAVPASESPEIHLLVRTAGQLEGALETTPASITLDYLELYGLRDSVDRIRAAGIEVRVASPRVLKPDEQRVVRFLLSLKCPILVRSGGLLHDLLKIPARERPALDGDFSLNLANVLSARAMLNRGLRRWTPAHDLNARQICELASAGFAGSMEPVVFHHLPVFHTEHCVFCRFMSDGTDHTNCGHPCEKHQVSLRDSAGRAHPVMADVGCRNTVFGAQIQSGARFLGMFRQAGIHRFRMEFVHQTANQVVEAAVALREYFQGNGNEVTLDSVFRKCCPAGTTDGSLFVPQGYRQLVQLNG